MKFSEVTAHYIFPEDRKLLYSFQLLLEEQFLKNHSVQHYSFLLSTTERKLSDITKKYLDYKKMLIVMVGDEGGIKKQIETKTAKKAF